MLNEDNFSRLRTNLSGQGGGQFAKSNKKFKLMLTRRAKAYSSSCSIV